jgi:hypothetical protein
MPAHGTRKEVSSQAVAVERDRGPLIWCTYAYSPVIRAAVQVLANDRQAIDAQRVASDRLHEGIIDQAPNLSINHQASLVPSSCMHETRLAQGTLMVVSMDPL